MALFHPVQTGTTIFSGILLRCKKTVSEERHQKRHRKRRRRQRQKKRTKERDKEQRSSVLGQTPVEETRAAGVEEEKEEVEPPAIAESTTTVPPGLFFKAGVGFLAWALWGHPPPFVQGRKE